MDDIIAVLLANIILVYLVRLMLALWQPPAARVPVEESLDQFGNYPSELVVTGRQRPNVQIVPCQNNYPSELVVTGRQRPNVQVVPCQNNYLHDTILPLLLLSILLLYVALYLLVCNGQIPEDDPVQEPVQCTNTGNAVTVVRGKDYPPPAD